MLRNDLDGLRNALRSADALAVNALGEKGVNALHLAIELDRDDAFALALIRNEKVDVDAHADDDEDAIFTPLHLAAMLGKLQILKALIERKADVSATASIGNTPLHMAASYARGAEVLQALLDAGANASTQDIEGYTALHLSVYAATTKQNEDVALDQIQTLLRHCDEQCQAKQTKADKKTALQLARELKVPSKIIKLLSESKEGQKDEL